MAEIVPIQPEHIPALRLLIYRQAAGMWNPGMPLEEAFAMYDRDGELADLDDIGANYLSRNGAFYVMRDGQRVIGAGAYRRMEDGVGEIKRLWFEPEYHGRGLGYRMLRHLLDEMPARGYDRVRLQTAPVESRRAYLLYQRVGFVEVNYPSQWEDEVWMEMALATPPRTGPDGVMPSSDME